MVAVGLLAMASLAMAAPDLNESFNALKEVVEKKDFTDAKNLAEAVAKDAKGVLAEPQPSSASEAEAWKARNDFAKQADDYAEYALSVGVVTAPALAVSLGDTLLEKNAKSKHVDTMAAAYLSALAKEGNAKASAGAQKILAGRPDNEDALYTLSSGNATYANRLVTVMRSKPKPEGVSDADWDKKKSFMIGNGLYMAGANACSRQAWADCDRSLRGAEPYMKGNNQMLGNVYFYLGVANFQLGSVTQDRNRMQQGLNYSKQAAGIAGPMQGQASTNVAAMTKQLGTPARR